VRGKGTKSLSGLLRTFRICIYVWDFYDSRKCYVRDCYVRENYVAPAIFTTDATSILQLSTHPHSLSLSLSLCLSADLYVFDY
jgi:hypothetical protein